MAAKTKRKRNLLKPAERKHINSLIADGKSDEALRYAKSTAHTRLFLNAAGNIDAIKSTSKRRTPLFQTCSVDGEFGSSYDRDSMIATSRDLVINFSLARGLIQTHVNNVVGSGPRIQFKTKDTDWNIRAEKHFARWGKTCDIRGVLNWGRFVRQIERRTIVDGDVGIILAKNLKLQGIEADRIANPPNIGTSDPNWVHGVRVDEVLRPLSYGVYSRGNANQCSGRKNSDYRKNVSAKNFVHSFDPDRFDQVRGLSALISAINDLQDSREALEAIKGTIKLENILALVLKLNSTSSTTGSPLGELTNFDINNAAGNVESRREFKVNQGVNTIEITPDEEVSAVKKETPNNNFNDWMQFQIRLAAMALDMPLEIAFHFYTRGSFSSLKGAIGQYHSAVKVRRSRLRDQILDRIGWWVIEGSIKRWRIEEAKGVPIGERMGLMPPEDSDVSPRLFDWQWDQLAFLEPDKQIKADVEEYKAIATTLQNINGKRGEDWENVMEQRVREYKKAEKLAKDEDVPLQLLLPQVNTPGQEIVGGEQPDTGDDDDE